MSKASYIQELTKYLSRIDQNLREDILRDYKEHFANGKESGRTDEQIIEKLGSPRSVANAYLIDSMFTEAKNAPTARSKAKMFLSAFIKFIMLAPFNFLVLMIPGTLLVVIIIVLAALAVAGLATFIAGIVGAVSMGLFAGSTPLILASIFFFLLTFLGAGLSLLALTIAALEGVGYLVFKYINWNVKLVTQQF